jgi:phosphoribosylformimino-5-aminoimidazole carboxamide ribotide isomerase
MKIIPAIDLLDGQCVRLLQGDYKKVTSYNISPINQANYFFKEGFRYLHIVDLDSAKNANNKNLNIIKSINKIKNLKIQVGGGIRDIQKVKDLLDIGIDRLIVGTEAIKNKNFLNALKNEVDVKKIVFGLDFKIIENEAVLYTNGWLEKSRYKLFDFIEKNSWMFNILATDISSDGMLSGPNIKIYEMILNKSNSNLIASGGISAVSDINNLKKIGIQECVVGKAIYENIIPIEDIRNAN